MKQLRHHVSVTGAQSGRTEVHHRYRRLQDSCSASERPVSLCIWSESSRAGSLWCGRGPDEVAEEQHLRPLNQRPVLQSCAKHQLCTCHPGLCQATPRSHHCFDVFKSRCIRPIRPSSLLMTGATILEPMRRGDPGSASDCRSLRRKAASCLNIFCLT